MLIQRGKDEGWLHLDVPALKTWAAASGIDFASTEPSLVPGRGVALLASRSLPSSTSSKSAVLLTLPADLVLSLEAVKKHALFDRHFRELLDSLGDFGKVGRIL